MDPVSAIGLASGILTFIDIGYNVVTGTLETAHTGRAPHTEHIDAVAHDLKDAVAKISKPVSSSASDPEKALGDVSARCQALVSELLALLERFKVSAAKPGMSWDSVKVAIRRMRNDCKVQELQKSLAEYRSQILLHLVTIISDRQVATQIQLGNSVGEIRTDLHGISDALEDVRNEVVDKLEQVQRDLRSATRPTPGTEDLLPDQNAVSENLAIQLREVKDALDHVTASHSEKTPETRILENVFFGNSMFHREETLKPAEEATFQWFVEGTSSEVDNDGGTRAFEESNREDPSRGPNFRENNAEVASRFENWLRSGSGVFHISGKAGSGKSTLMKLVLSTERTHELLGEWAHGKRLLFARFYFWAGGEQMQNSLEGLQRSILFEVLIQRPELVKRVFHEVYPIVANSSWDSPIHSRFFTTASFQKAFERLLSLPVDPRYRLCLFIDGLDEYGAEVHSGSLPETQGEDLAQSLLDWSSNDHIKILVSSRPYPEFTDTFVEDQRVHLHQLTRTDMFKFGCRLFERHRVFRFPGVKERYRSLVGDVVNASNGVFLWTGLTIQRLLASLAKRDSFESLEKQLEATPRDLSRLYENMFLEIDEQDRYEAMKMMLLVSEERKHLESACHPRGVNAMAISWLSSLDDPDFPVNQPFIVCSEGEIEEKRQFAESRVNGYTRGLLEVNTDIPKSDREDLQEPLYMLHTIQFFHRTALEYVAASPLALDILSSSPTLFNLEFYTRLSLAELRFGSLSYPESRRGWICFGRYPAILTKYLSTPMPCRSLIEAYRSAFEQQPKYFAGHLMGFVITGLGRFRPIGRPNQSASFDHWVASRAEGAFVAQYLTERIHPDLLCPRNGLSLLLSIACSLSTAYQSDRTSIDLLKMALGLGVDLHCRTRLRIMHLDISTELTVWQAWCVYYVAMTLSAWREKDDPQLFEREMQDNLDQILELFLENGVSSDCYILITATPVWINFKQSDEYDSEISSESDSEGSGDGDKESSSWEGHSESDRPAQQPIAGQRHTDPWNIAVEDLHGYPTDCLFESAYVVSLGDLIRQAKPANYEKLDRLLGENSRTHDFSTTELREIEIELASSNYPHFKSPTIQPVDLNQFYADNEDQQLLVYWIRWKDATVPGFVEFRLC